MSRKGKLPVPVPKGIEVKLSEGKITVKGPKGTLEQNLQPEILVKSEGEHLSIQLTDPEDRNHEHLHGLYRSLIANMVEGVHQGFIRKLEMIGVGYRAAVQGHMLDLSIGFSHPTKLPIPAGVDVKVDKNTMITVQGANKQMVGQFAATVRAVRPPEPYQGKGIRYEGEYVRKKAGKAAAKK